MSEAIRIDIIGGSGLYDMAELTDREERTVTTPFGDPSGPYVVGTLRGQTFRQKASSCWASAGRPSFSAVRAEARRYRA